MSQEPVRKPERERVNRLDYGVMIALGLGGGAALGAALGAFDRGVLLGLLAATILHAYFEWRAGRFLVVRQTARQLRGQVVVSVAVQSGGQARTSELASLQLR
ncbi:MAG: hypothetical protein R6V28_14390 [Nitriliruptoraceae bacterium]